MLPLSFAKSGRYRVKAIRGGRGLTNRLISIGIVEGDEIEVMENSRGPVLIAKGDLRVAIGFGMAHKVWVEPTGREEISDGER